MPLTTANNHGKKKTKKPPVQKRRLKPNQHIHIMFGEMSRRQNEDITKEKTTDIGID